MGRYQIQKYAQSITVADGDVAANADTILSLNGLLKGIMANVPALSGSNTLTIALKNSDGYTIFSKASIAESAKYAQFVDANNQPLELPLNGIHNITVTSSGAESPAVVIPVVLLIQRG